MNVFENLIEELKEENLIEETVIDVSRQEELNSKKKAQTAETGSRSDSDPAANVFAEEQSNSGENGEAGEREPAAEMNETTKLEAESSALDETPPAFEETSSEIPLPAPDNSAEHLKTAYDEPSKAQSADEDDFFRRRAMEEVSSLKIVEHIISGVEREQLKTLPKTFNDISVSKALHDFLQISKNGSEQESASAEFTLMQETESWYSALSHRDKNISVGELRRYCETTKPALSPQALIALARFYRNSPYSEHVRAKFDMVLTRLLTKEIGNEKRELNFEREELIRYLGELYANWSSIPVYAPDDDSEILIATLKFEDFMNEAEAAENFEELVRNDFFERLRLFKESAGENFYAPLVTATGIESNVRVGNRWVELIRREREKADIALLEEKYGLLLDQTVSDVTSKSVQLVDLLKTRNASAEPVVEKKEKLNYEPARSDKTPLETSAPAQPRKHRLPAMNKWLLAGLILTILVSASMVVWVDFMTPQTKVSPNVKKVNLEDSSLKDDLKAARINADIFYGVVQPSWDAMPAEKKEELLRKLYSVGGEKGYKEVQLMNAEGKTVGYASSETITVSNR